MEEVLYEGIQGSVRAVGLFGCLGLIALSGVVIFRNDLGVRVDRFINNLTIAERQAVCVAAIATWAFRLMI